ncbi:DDX58 [Mytilus edulis]|uniref:DDX58 n=1 Tax=Mytilus edulis TaxID=6550 RepID=A0A8S3VAR4_MYTED|nr:DDX58 [Mytilus edulis]
MFSVNLQLLIDDQPKNAALVKQVKDELLEQLIKHKDVKKCRVEWRLQTPDTWNLNEIKETLEKFSGVLRPWFEIEFVHVGSLVIKTLVPKEVLDNRDQMKKSIQAFLEKMVELCHINTELSTVIKVDLVVSDESDTTELSQELSAYDSVVSERKEECTNLRNYQIELAEIALRGENTIIYAESGAGKTYVSFHVIEKHLLNYPRASEVQIAMFK